ncbi:MAG TPA: YdcF family protein [Amycolatopsis sp.]|nr:YdcF family protein [Amycolatopsis sp.]
MARIPGAVRADVQALWDFHRIDDDPSPVDVAIGLGSHDPGVPVHTAELYHRGLFPLIVFTGANAPTTVGRFPRGEAVHYREIALERGVPATSVLVEPRATHTGQNIDFSRALLEAHGIRVRSILLTCRPYQQRRAFATARRRWPEVDVRCSADPRPLDEYVAGIGDAGRVINMLVGDTQRLPHYADLGEAIEQPVPPDVEAACRRLIRAGYTARLLPGR